LELNVTYQLLVSADDDNIIGQKHKHLNTEAPIDASKDVGLEANTEKAKIIFILSPKCRTISYFSYSK
jgi:hypothetical protein